MGRPIKFSIDNWFDKTIIKKNKDKVRPSANAILHEFLKEIVALNIISLTKTRKVMNRENGAVNHGNYYSAINNTIHISKLFQLLVEDGMFEEYLGQMCDAETLDLFLRKTAKMTTKISLHKY